MIKFTFSYIFTILKLNLFKSIIILIAYNVGFMAHNPKVAGSNGVQHANARRLRSSCPRNQLKPQ